jgi:hypothetical protein
MREHSAKAIESTLGVIKFEGDINTGQHCLGEIRGFGAEAVDWCARFYRFWRIYPNDSNGDQFTIDDSFEGVAINNALNPNVFQNLPGRCDT